MKDQRRHDVTRRDFLRVLGYGGLGTAALGSLGLTGAQAAPAGRRKLTIMTVGGSWGDSIRQMIVEPVARKHNADLAWDNRPNAQQVAALLAMRGNPTVDTVEMGGNHLFRATMLGLLDPIDSERVPYFAQVHPAFKNRYWAARSAAPFVLTFNKDRVKKATAEAQGWRLLLDPALKGRVAIPKFGWMGEWWLHALNLTLGGNYDNLDRAVQLTRQLIRQNGGIVMESNDHGMKMFTTGEIWAAPFWTGRTYELGDKGVPLEFVFPKGWVAYTFGFVIVKGTPNKDLVEKVIDYSISPEVQLAVARRFSYLPTLASVKVPADLPRLKIAKSDLDKAVNLDFGRMVQHSDANLERWNKEILG